jgi:ADP-ribose pyrophosphatase
MDLIEKVTASNYPFKGRIINLRVDDVVLPNGHRSTREVVEHHGGVCVAALTDSGEVLMVRQYRHPYKEVVLEIPAGKLEPGEDPLECGKRELREETGASAEEYEFLGQLYPSPGYCGEIIYMFAAKGLSFGDTDPDEDEFLEAERVPLKDAVKMIMNGEIKDAKTQAAVLKLYFGRTGKD